jgi:drug/metabolite transporter (DMT)-like permease
MYTSTPFIAAILSYIIFKEKLTIKKIMGIIIGLAGLAPVIYLQGAGEKGCSEILHISLPEVSLAIAIISGAYAWFIVKELMGHGYSLLLINGSAMFVGGILSMITALCVTGFTCPVYNWGYFLFWLSLLILSANVIFYNLYGTLLRIYSITFLSFAGFLSPVFGTFYDWLFMGGIISWHYILALVLITAGLYIFYSQELTLRAQKVHE